MEAIAGRKEGIDLLQLQLGCPKKCEEYTCIDLFPEDEGVIASEAVHHLDWLASNSVDRIYSKNMLEHITELNEFFTQAKRVLKPQGTLTIITDNAAFLPFHIPIIHKWGWGAHSSNKYFDNYKYAKCGVHYVLFTKNGLRNIFEKYGFNVQKLRLVTFGARILVEGFKT